MAYGLKASSCDPLKKHFDKDVIALIYKWS